MLFNSITFLVFFAVVFVTYRLIPTWRVKKIVLLLASYVFYAAWNPPYILILVFSTFMDWRLARAIDRSQSTYRRKQLLLLSVAANLSLLGFFKYGGFLLENFHWLLSQLGFDYAAPGWNIVLPVGISFYTFASLSYTIDVYRREMSADVGFLDYALFVSFFPHLVAGPILRARAFLPQLRAPTSIARDQIGWGLSMVVFGLFSKTVLADSVFAPIVDSVYSKSLAYGALDTWTAALAFSGQIYYDFCGYSLCAIGLALSFGFAFPDNFRYPYAARGFADFWRRWHISLSTWLRDYLYIPMGGSQKNSIGTYRNLILTMLVGGLWHGASWMFVLWGALHGVLLAVERFCREHSAAYEKVAQSVWFSFATFIVVTVVWIPFRAHDPQTAWAVLTGLHRFESSSHLDAWTAALCLMAIALTLLWHFSLRDRSFESYVAQLNAVARGALISICLIAIFLCSGGDERAFIYFQF